MAFQNSDFWIFWDTLIIIVIMIVMVVIITIVITIAILIIYTIDIVITKKNYQLSGKEQLS